MDLVARVFRWYRLKQAESGQRAQLRRLDGRVFITPIFHCWWTSHLSKVFALSNLLAPTPAGELPLGENARISDEVYYHEVRSNKDPLLLRHYYR